MFIPPNALLMYLVLARKLPPFNRASLLLWTGITLLFLYERTYLIQKAGLPHLIECVTVRVGLLLLLCQVHNEILSRLLSQQRFVRYGFCTAGAVGLYLLVQGAYDQYLFGYVIGDQKRGGLWQNLPYNLLVTGWYLLLTYLIRTSTRPGPPPSMSVPARPADAVLTIKTGTQWVQIPVAEIRYVQGLKDYSLLFAGGDKHILKGSIGKIADLLPDGQFIRVHKSYVVARHYIKAVSVTGIVLDGQTIPVGRTYLASVLTQFKRGH